jgi:predicted secreted protein
MSNATAGIGCKLKMGDGGGSEVFTAIAEIKGFDGPDYQVSLAEVTNFDSSGGVKEWLPTLIDAGSVSFTANFLPDDTIQTSVRTAMLAKTKKNFKIEFTDSTPTVASFSGYITGYKVTAPLADAVQVACTIKITGNVTYA